MLKALIFDVDGTLADTERDGHRIAFNLAFGDVGLKWHWDVGCYGQLLEVTGGKERILHYAKLHDTTFLSQDKLNEKINGLHICKTRHYIALLQRSEILLRPGIEQLLKKARKAGISLAIATTTSAENVTALIKSTLGLGALDWFDVIAAGDSVAAKKPAPDIYNYVLNELSLSAKECIAFEDSSIGLRSATSAGLTTIITHNNYTNNQNFSGAAVILDQLDESNFDLQSVFELHATLNHSLPKNPRSKLDVSMNT